MRRVLGFGTAILFVVHAASAADMPPFLHPYFVDAFNTVGAGMVLQQQETKENVTRYLYGTPDQVATLSAENFACERDRCQVVYNNAVTFFDKQATDNGGHFLKATMTEFAVQWQTGLADNVAYVAKMPAAIIFMTYSTRIDRHVDYEAFATAMSEAVNRQRYDTVPHNEPLAIALWSTAIHDYAHSLLKNGQKDEAVNVLTSLLLGVPFDYRAQTEIVENSRDPEVQRKAALVVYNQAEDPELVAKAARYLGRAEPEFASLPRLEIFQTGLQLILIPLPPCDLRLLNDVAALYQKSTKIPVHIEPLDGDWTLGEPGRIPDQRLIQQTLIQRLGPNTNFRSWTRNRYKTELLKSVEKSSALARYSVESYVSKLDSRPGQYDAQPFISRLIDAIAQYRSRDVRTMYVGVTSLDLYFADTNYVFSARDRGLAVASYYRMMASSVGDSYQSRARVSERFTKELIPASIGLLGIPRPADPTDPYSFANSVQRVDQKTLTLSAPTMEALDKFR